MPPVIKKSLLTFATASEFGVPVEDIMGRGRKQQIADARQAAIYIGSICGHGHSALAGFFRRTRGAIPPAIQACKDKMDTDKKYFAHVSAISARLMQATCNPPATLQHRHD